MEVRVQNQSETCGSCGEEVAPDSARGERRPAPIETGLMDLRNLPQPPRDHRAPWRR
jgi:hypothetical protein